MQGKIKGRGTVATSSRYLHKSFGSTQKTSRVPVIHSTVCGNSEFLSTTTLPYPAVH